MFEIRSLRAITRWVLPNLMVKIVEFFLLVPQLRLGIVFKGQRQDIPTETVVVEPDGVPPIEGRQRPVDRSLAATFRITAKVIGKEQGRFPEKLPQGGDA